MAEKKSFGKYAVWFVLGLVAVAMVGFGQTDFSGSTRTIAKVGEKELYSGLYLTEMDRTLNALSGQDGQRMSFATAASLGVDQQVLNRQIDTLAVNNETTRLGISIGDATLAEQIVAIPSFQNLSGEFDNERYESTLRRLGLSTEQFESTMRDDTASLITRAAVRGAVARPEGLGKFVLGYVGETRNLSIVELVEADLTSDIPEPSADELAAYYEANTEAYTSKESREVNYAWLTPEMLSDEIDVDEEQLRQLYEERSAQYNVPERRLVERLAYADAEKAQTEADRIASGDITFEDAVAARGLQLSNIDLGDVTREELGEAAEPVFSAEVGDVVGPLPSEFGPALYRVNAELSEQVASFEDARPELEEELATARAGRLIESARESLDDLLAGGAGIADLAERAEMETGTITYSAGDAEGVAAYPEFREKAENTEIGAYPEVTEFDDGGIVILEVTAVNPPALIPLDEVKDDVVADWKQAKAQELLLEQAESLAVEIGTETDISALGLEIREESNVSRRTFLPGAEPGLLDVVFQMTPEDAKALASQEGAWVVRLDEIVPVDFESDDAKAQLEGLVGGIQESIANDLYAVYVANIRANTDISINQAALNAANANIQ